MRTASKFYFVLYLCLTLLLSTSLVAQPPALSGKVLKMRSEGPGPLGRARVELLSPGTHEIKHHTYTDRRGKYTFPTVTPGKYELRIKLGGRLLSQITRNKEVKKRKITLRGRPARLVITVAAW